MFIEPQGAFMYRSSIVLGLSISVFFHGLLLTVFESKVISMVVEPQGVLTCWSSRLAAWADSGPFLGLLVTVLGSQSDFHD